MTPARSGLATQMWMSSFALLIDESWPVVPPEAQRTLGRVAPVRVIEMVAGERRAPVFQYPDQASIGDERRHHVFHHDRQPRAMKGGVDEQVHVVQDEGAIDVDVDAASVALELPGIEAAGGRQADVAAAVMREVLRFDRDAVVCKVGRASDDHPPQIRADA